MNLRQLEAFRATMRTGSITGAAALLFISQPSVSRLVADLERSLGFTLFNRRGQGLVATVEARKFHQSVESMFFGLDKLRDIAEIIRTARDESISVGVIPAFANVVMPEAICTLRQKNPSLLFNVSVRNTPSIVDDVLLRQTDVGMICPTRRYDGVHVLHEMSAPYVCLIPTQHPLINVTGDIDIDQCAREECVVLDPIFFDQQGEETSPLVKLRKNARIVSRSDPAIAAISRAANLPAIVDPYTAKAAAAMGGVEVRKLRQDVRYPIHIIARDADSLSMAANGLAESLVEALQAFSPG